MSFSTCFQRLLMLFLWLFFLARVDSQNQSGEVQILLSFKDAVDVPQFFDNTDRNIWMQTDNSGGYWSSWKATDKTPCYWVGVTCTANFTVEQLDLSGWGLRSFGYPQRAGMVSSLQILSNLTDLRQLDLSSNYLEFEIPSDIQTLIQLTRLDLSGNAFSGPIPNISACRSLRYLSLERNQLSGDIPSLSGMVDLQVLLLADNQLAGPFPKELGEMNSFVRIDLSNNMLNGTIPSLAKLVNLLDLKLDNNRFTGLEGPNMFLGANSLEHVSISGNELEDTIPSSLVKLLNLNSLNMSRNRLSGNIPFGFGFPRPKSQSFSLDLSQNQLTGKIPSDLLRFNSSEIGMVAMNMSHNLLSGSIPLNGTMDGTSYAILDLSHNSLSGPIPSFFNNGDTSISSLCLQNNLLTGDIVDVFADGANHGLYLTAELRLGNNSFTGDLSRMANLSISWKFLEVADLSNNNFRMSSTTGIPDPLKALLESFSGTSPLRELRLGGNNFSGISLPTNLSTIDDFLNILDLSNNHLKGQISGMAFNSTWLPSLQFLDLSNNEANGSIPETIIMLPNLVVLNVSSNNLSGPLPYIPPSSRLHNTDFFAGNVELCGDPLKPCRQPVPSRRTGIQWWVLLIIIGGSVLMAMGSCLAATWQWRVYRKRHQQDTDLIKTLLERESTTLMPLRELKKATDNFAESAQIGDGGFGTVYIGKLSNGTMVAIKRSKREGSEKDKELFLNEVRILSQLNHRYLVKLLGCCMENKIALLVFEFVSNGTLQEHLQGKVGGVPLSWKQRLNVSVQTAEALNYLHSAATIPIYHRDVKSANILLTDDLNAKVADFGISRLAPIEATHISTVAVQGTIGYIDPEYYSTYQLTDKSDVYSFGVVLLELLSAKPPIDFQRGGEETSLVYFAKPHIENGDLQQLLDPALMDTYKDPTGHGRESILNVGRLALKCLNMRSKARPNMNEVEKVLQNLWLKLNGKLEDLGSTNEDDNMDELWNLKLKFDEISKYSASINEDDNEHPPHDNRVLLSQSFSGDSSSFVLQNDVSSDVQMSKFSPPFIPRAR